MSNDQIYNTHGLVRKLNTPWISVSSHWFALHWLNDEGKTMNHVYRLREGPSLHDDKSNEKICYGSWAESVKVAQRRFGIDPSCWVPLLGQGHQGDWFPSIAVELAKSQKLHWRDNPKSKIKFGEPGRPCTELISGDGFGGSHACGRLAIHQVPSSGMGSEDGIEYRCKMHQGHAEKRAANAAERHERWAAQDEERKRKNANRDRCQEVLEQIRPLLTELGIHPDTLDVGEAPGGKVGILLPAEVAELLTGKAIELEEIIGGNF